MPQKDIVDLLTHTLSVPLSLPLPNPHSDFADLLSSRAGSKCSMNKAFLNFAFCKKQNYILLNTFNIMEKLLKLSDKKAAGVPKEFKRFLHSEIDWNQQLIVILGQRGTGKTTFLLQMLHKNRSNAIYLSLDDIYFEANRLISLIDILYEQGYRRFFLDEAHRYRYWSKDLKNAYDNYPDVQMVVTGSSILQIRQGQEDLSRRATVYNMPGLSFREFLHLQYNKKFKSQSLKAILESHFDIANEYHDRANIMSAFGEYLQYGYYPFSIEGEATFFQKLREMTSLILDVDVAPFEDLNYSTVRNMKKLIYVISQSVPFKPNISKISKKLSIPRNTVLKLLDLLERAGLIALLKSDTKGISYLQKPEKIYLQNPNLIDLYSDHNPETGNVRETFFMSQLSPGYTITSSKFADFMVDGIYTFEVGGPTKTNEQIRGIPNAYIAADRIEGGSGNKIPLWLFGFLY